MTEATDDEILDEVTRYVPLMYANTRKVWDGGEVPGNPFETERIRGMINRDPDGVFRILLNLEGLYQKQLTSANLRDRRIKEAEEETERLRRENEELRQQRPTGVQAGDFDEGEAAEEKLMEELRQEWEREREVLQKEGAHGTR